MKRERKPPVIFFNASVILAGLKSPKGGSAKLLSWSRKRIIIGIISEIILDEVIRNTPKIGFKKEKICHLIKVIFSRIEKAPNQKSVNIYRKLVLDEGDAHILASCSEIKSQFLVTLDKKHLLVLKNKVKGVKIVSPGELIEKLSEKRYQ